MSFSQPLSPGGESARFSPIHDRDRHGRAYSCWPGESVTRGDRRRRELVLENSSPPLAGQHESTARLRLRIGHRRPNSLELARPCFKLNTQLK